MRMHETRPTRQTNIIHVRHSPPSGTAFSFPLRDGGWWSIRSGELAIATEVNDGRRFVAPIARGDRLLVRTGDDGSDPCIRGEDFIEGEEPSPPAASVRRNSTQRREND